MEPVVMTKRYRLIWDRETLEIKSDHERDFGGTETTMGNPARDAFESDSSADVRAKIDELGLVEPSEEDV